MKKLMVVCMCLATLAMVAQERKGKRGMDRAVHKDFTPEQVAELKTKKMALDLNLSEAQQAQVQELELAQAKTRMAQRKQMNEQQEGKSEDRFAKRSNMLDQQIELKKRMKNILTEEQFEKWEKRHKKRGKARRDARKHKK